MTHFAYPNVLSVQRGAQREKRFLGCGRYLAAPYGEPPGAAYEEAAPNIYNLAEVHAAALKLAPESGDVRGVIYEYKDAPPPEQAAVKFAGESLDLAYLLALISRSRKLTFTPSGDIWCTGCIKKDPFLETVDFGGFTGKLQAFLTAAENPADYLFLAPAANLLPAHEPLLQAADADVVTLARFQPLALPESPPRKTIVKVHGDELFALVALLFEPPPAALPSPVNPYRGLFAFREEDAALFFGREAAIAQLVQAVETKPFVAVIGSSGSGKSSVVAAGLLPRLRRQQHWLIAAFRPGGQPLRALAAALLSALNPGLDDIDKTAQVKKLVKHLQIGSLTLKDFLQTLLSKHPQARLLLFVDQFEELYTLCPDETERRRFLAELLPAGQVSQTWAASDYQLTVVMTMRADFLGKAFAYRPLADAFQNADLVLGPMNRAELQEVIARPAANLRVAIEEGLTGRMLDAVGDEPGNLPLLEFALTQLWERQDKHTERKLTHAAYDQLGGVAQALSSYAESVHERLTAAEQAQAQRIFMQLVRPGEGTEDTRRIARRADLGEESWRTVTKLAQARLVVTNQRASEQAPAGVPEETVEIAHETLIRGWQRLREWMAADREFRLWQEHLRLTMQQSQALARQNRFGRLVSRKYDPDLMLRGRLLQEAKKWLTQKPEAVSSEEHQFIAFCKKALRRQSLGRKILFIPLVAIGGGLVVGIFLVWLAVKFNLF